MNFTDIQYDELIASLEEAEKSVGPLNCVVARSVEEVEAFAYWCIENGFEEPRIMVKQL